jgi:hypothetical protein
LPEAISEAIPKAIPKALSKAVVEGEGIAGGIGCIRLF